MSPLETLRAHLGNAEVQGASAHERRPTAESAMELDTIRWVIGLIDALPASDPRAEALAYLRSLPAGGVAAIVAEARVAEWDRHILRGGRDTLHWHIAHVDGTFGVRQHDAMLVGEHATEVAARSWIETAAIADGWTIARGGGGGT